MDSNPQYMEGFIQRFRQLEAHKDLSNSLIRDILTYCDQLEQRNAQLVQQQNDDKLELDDARRSRRELQRELGLANQTIDRYNISYDLFRVGERMMADARREGYEQAVGGSCPFPFHCACKEIGRAHV